MTTFKLGDKLRDRVTGFVGVAVAKTEYLTGCNRWSLQAQVGTDGKIPEWASFDEITLEYVDEVFALDLHRGQLKDKEAEKKRGWFSKPGGPQPPVRPPQSPRR